MRIKNIYLASYGPFQDAEILHLDTNDERVLFLGVSGSGKTTVLRAITSLWMVLGAYLNHAAVPQYHTGTIAMTLETQGEEVVVACGDASFFEYVKAQHAKAWWLHFDGEVFRTSDATVPKFGNMCFLDGDELDDEASSAPWLITDSDIRSIWKGESSLDCEQKKQLAQVVNELLLGKKLEVDERGQFIVRLSSGKTHALRALSTGEKRMIGLCFLACASLKDGGILLLDEPDVHLHPSQLLGLIAIIENSVLEKGGQVMLISHHPEVWNRYDLLGKVVILEGRA